MIISGVEHDNITVADKQGNVIAVIADNDCIAVNGIQIHQNATFVKYSDNSKMKVATAEYGGMLVDVETLNALNALSEDGHNG